MIKKSKPVPEVHKIKLISVSNINKQCFKSAKSNEEPIVKPQTKEKSYPPTIKNCTNYNCDHATILSSIQSDNSLGGNLGYSETHPYTYDRFVIYYFPLKLPVLVNIFLYFKVFLQYSCSTRQLLGSD